MAQKPTIPKGTRDFSPTEVAKRNYIFASIKQVFETFGFQPIETPSFENYGTLMGKYGEEGDRLIFKILNSGDYLKKVDETLLQAKESNKLTPKISEKALRYDLTVPFARYVVQHQNDIEFPFKRYQMQPVWRADRPQKGRFREFYQCDADVVGSKGLWQEVEFVQLYDEVFSKLKLTGTTIKLNNRKILAGIAEIIGAKDKLIDFTVALDKLDKIGAEGVTKEMISKGITTAAIEKVQPLFHFNGSNQEKITQLQEMLAESEEGLQGVKELRFVVDNIEILGLQSAKLDLDVTLARGLNYYTGAIYEVSAPDGVKMGSIGGGGRYDDLTGIFGLKNVSGVGISFGLDRIYLVLEELNLFDAVELPKPKVLFINFGETEAAFCMKALAELRKLNIKSELYPENAKMKKQMNYANRREIPFVVLVGADEVKNNIYTLKNMQTGEQQACSLEELLKITV
ncbi:histidine--tRNA ligase [Lutibacter holmesii]|uniref:Histidine--tRNA ligase n=1 Tax=Lutibacter holmesii TaxID=1137985 RepID=A0ABW3WPU2_9FLAO